MSVKLQNYFFNMLLPEVVTCTNVVCADSKQKYYSIYKRPYFESMTACDVKHSDTDWYHDARVQLNRL